MSPNKIETLNFDGRYDPWIFDMQTCDMNQFFEQNNLSSNKRVRFAKMIIINEARFYQGDVEDCLEKKR